MASLKTKLKSPNMWVNLFYHCWCLSWVRPWKVIQSCHITYLFWMWTWWCNENILFCEFQRLLLRYLCQSVIPCNNSGSSQVYWSGAFYGLSRVFFHFLGDWVLFLAYYRKYLETQGLVAVTDTFDESLMSSAGQVAAANSRNATNASLIQGNHI